MMMIVKKIKTKAVPRFSMTVRAFSRNRPSQEKIDLSAFIDILQSDKKLKDQKTKKG